MRTGECRSNHCSKAPKRFAIDINMLSGRCGTVFHDINSHAHVQRSKLVVTYNWELWNSKAYGCWQKDVDLEFWNGWLLIPACCVDSAEMARDIHSYAWVSWPRMSRTQTMWWETWIYVVQLWVITCPWEIATFLVSFLVVSLSA